jgi:XTP/dITP diphosphohydrolase
MQILQTLVLATGNSGKVKELTPLLAPLGWRLRSQSEFAVPESPEPHLTFIENALAKARHAAHYTGFPAVADDSGLCVAALHGAPGVLSARYAAHTALAVKSDDANNAKLLKEMAGIQMRQAHFICVLVAVKTATDPEPLIATGRWQGTIAGEMTGTEGFGYDPLFVCKQYKVSAAAMSPAQKNTVGHRGQAIAALLPLIQSLWAQ